MSLILIGTKIKTKLVTYTVKAIIGPTIHVALDQRPGFSVEISRITVDAEVAAGNYVLDNSHISMLQ